MINDSKRTIRIGLISGFILLVVIYAFIGSYDLVFGVKIKNVNLTSGQTTEGNIQEVSGNAKNAISLKLNGHEISIDKEGDFKETIALSPGYNIVNIEALDKFGHNDSKDYQLIYNP